MEKEGRRTNSSDKKFRAITFTTICATGIAIVSVGLLNMKGSDVDSYSGNQALKLTLVGGGIALLSNLVWLIPKMTEDQDKKIKNKK